MQACRRSSKERKLPGDATSLDNGPVGLDVTDRDATVEEALCDQHVTVALAVIAFTAHHNYGLSLGKGDQLVDSGLVAGCLLYARVGGAFLPGVVQRRILRSAAQSISHRIRDLTKILYPVYN